jgi:uncharacterized membrane protein YphA (DoxX/SURF4 family)
MKNILIKVQLLINKAAGFCFIAPLALRLYLVPVFWVAGMNKINNFDDIVNWFGNPDWGLGLPNPEIMAFLATMAEVGGAVFLLFGFATRWASIPLIVTMVVAITQVHWQNGWQSVHDLMSPWAAQNAEDAVSSLDKVKELLKEHGNISWLTDHGSLVISNNGIEWAVTYLIMLLALFALGGGKYTSVDYWLGRKYMA